MESGGINTGPMHPTAEVIERQLRRQALVAEHHLDGHPRKPWPGCPYCYPPGRNGDYKPWKEGTPPHATDDQTSPGPGAG